ncbi:hemolymph lipopolysaccharide-binding protein-like [Athalia rosae]|uniref:hemolymph lipopolysaccharide-binding protein-like n=1 Tax=Athalia rosae TaxID=37344 RepID=UPI002034352A|nr:hemolymph lipopolysaccharide-binding protein-like [Athalia rosae]
MWKLLVIAFLTQVSAAPSVEPNTEQNFRPSRVQSTETPCHCPSSSNSPAQIESGTGTNHPLPWGSSNSMQNLVLHGMPCVCSLGPSRLPIRDDYKYTPGVGSHKLHTRALPWNEARKMCNEEGGHLAVINSVVEAQVLMDMFNTSGPIKNAAYNYVAYVGIHDLYKEGEWVSISGESLARTGYTKWTDKWGGQPDNGEGKQHCGAFFNEGGLDDVACDAAFAYFCELPTMQFFH